MNSRLPCKVFTLKKILIEMFMLSNSVCFIIFPSLIFVLQGLQKVGGRSNGIEGKTKGSQRLQRCELYFLIQEAFQGPKTTVISIFPRIVLD